MDFLSIVTIVTIACLLVATFLGSVRFRAMRKNRK